MVFAFPIPQGERKQGCSKSKRNVFAANVPKIDAMHSYPSFNREWKGGSEGGISVSEKNHLVLGFQSGFRASNGELIIRIRFHQGAGSAPVEGASRSGQRVQGETTGRIATPAIEHAPHSSRSTNLRSPRKATKRITFFASGIARKDEKTTVGGELQATPCLHTITRPRCHCWRHTEKTKRRKKLCR